MQITYSLIDLSTDRSIRFVDAGQHRAASGRSLVFQMAASPVQAELDQVVGDCAKQPLDKPDAGLLQKAFLHASLADRIYSPAQIADAQLQSSIACAQPHTVLATSVPAQSPDTKLKAKLLCGPVPGLPVHAVWEVQTLGVVAVFSGTAALQGVYADICFSPVQLANSDIKLHGAIYNGAAKCVSSIQAAYNKAAQRCSNQNPPALYLTGSESLPMLYHIESSILTCTRQAIRLVEGMHCAPFLKSWQPAIHCQLLL